MSATLLPTRLPVDELRDNERDAAQRLLDKLQAFQDANERQRKYYDALQDVRDLGIAIPPHLRDLEAALGWPSMAVDVLNERLRHDGWIVPGGVDLGIDEIVDTNKLNREFRVGHRTAMKYGIAFAVAGAGGRGDPNPLVTVEPPTRMTVTWDRRRKRVDEALLISTNDKGETDGATLWTDDGWFVELALVDKKWELIERRPNRLRRPPVVRLVNRYDDTAAGRSEITRPLRAYTDNAVRTVVAMEVSRDFHAAPKFWLLGADESQFVGPDGKRKTPWETYIGRLAAIPATGDEKPEVKHFPGASPAPFIEQLRALAQLAAAETAMPVKYLGLVHDSNPASADAGLLDEARLNIRAEERMDDFGEDEGELMRIAVWIRDGDDPGVTPRPNWRPAATPTLSAAADATQKLVTEGVLPPQSDITLKRIGLNEVERQQLADERRRERSRETITVLAAAADAARSDPEVVELASRR